MPKNPQTLAQLKAQITQLKQENTKLKAYLKEIIETAYQAINHDQEAPSNELNPEEIKEWRQKIRQEVKHE